MVVEGLDRDDRDTDEAERKRGGIQRSMQDYTKREPIKTRSQFLLRRPRFEQVQRTVQIMRSMETPAVRWSVLKDFCGVSLLLGLAHRFAGKPTIRCCREIAWNWYA